MIKHENVMDRSAFLLCLKKKTLRMPQGCGQENIKLKKGFIRDLAAISSVKENAAMTRNRRLTGENFIRMYFLNR